MADVCIAESEKAECSDLSEDIQTEKPPGDAGDVTKDAETSKGNSELQDSGRTTISVEGAKLNPFPPANPFASKPHLKVDVVSTLSQQSHTSVHIAPSKLGVIPFTSQKDPESKTEFATSPSKSLLRPSALSAQVQNLEQKDVTSSKDNPFLLKPAKLFDPKSLKKNGKDSDEKKEKENQEQPVKDDLKENLSNKKEDKQSENYFAAAATKKNRLAEVDECSEKPENFVFGQNLAERVTGVTTPTPTTPNGSEKAFVFGENLADRVVQSEKSEEYPSDQSSEQTTPDRTQTLEESAREYQAKHEHRTELKEVEVKTGEENESNVLQAVGKLYLFDGSTQTYVEKGRGQLRLNDKSATDSTVFHSRLVMRTQGSLRVILNTKIWAGMTVERASQKSVRITATDGDEGVKVFLIVTNPKDTENLLQAVAWRIQIHQLRRQEKDDEEKPASTTTTEKRKAESVSPTNEVETKKQKKTEDSSSIIAPVRREESDSSVLDPETDASSESYTSSLTMRSESD